MSNPEDGVLGDFLHVHVGRLVEAAEGPRSSRRADVDGCQEDVQVLGVRDEDDEARDDGDVEEQEHRFQHAVHATPRGASQLATSFDAKAQDVTWCA